MKNLKKYLVLVFMAITASIAVLGSAIDSVFEAVANNISDSQKMFFAVVLYCVVCLLGYGLFVWLFVRLVSKKIEKENRIYNQNRNLLFANIAHDLKTPLTTIIDFSRVLSDNQVIDEEKQRELLESIHNKSQKVNELLDRMCEYTKMDGDDYILNLQEQDVSKIVKEVVAQNYRDFENKDMEIAIEIPEESV